MIDGSAMVTSRMGKVSATDQKGEAVSVNARDTVLPSGLKLDTDDNGQIFLTFSNGVALGLDVSSSIECRQYTQRPFNQQELSRGLEPSISKLLLNFTRGQIAIASNRLSPLSELRIQLQQGEIRLHKGSCLISYEPTGLQITAFEGNLTYYYPGASAREFVSAPKSIRISPQSMSRKQVAESRSTESLTAEQLQLCKATQHASKRVLFEANQDTMSPPIPFLITRPAYFEKPSMRPYQLKD
jgi:hypothetical protein